MIRFRRYILNAKAQIAFSLYRVYRFAVLPWKRTSVKWTAIIFNDAGQFAVTTGNVARHLPTGQIKPDETIERQCYSGLGLDKSDFAIEAPLRLVHIGGQAGRSFTFYFSGQLNAKGQSFQRFKQKAVYLSRTELRSFIPTELLEKL